MFQCEHFFGLLLSLAQRNFSQRRSRCRLQTRVQSDVVARVQESRRQLEVEIRKLLREVSRMAEQSLRHARAARAEGVSAVEAGLARLQRNEGEVLSLRLSQRE